MVGRKRKKQVEHSEHSKQEPSSKKQEEHTVPYMVLLRTMVTRYMVLKRKQGKKRRLFKRKSGGKNTKPSEKTSEKNR